MPPSIQRWTKKKPRPSTQKPEPRQVVLVHTRPAPHRQITPVLPANPTTLGVRVKLTVPVYQVRKRRRVDLVTSINRRLKPKDQLDQKLLREEFNQWWEALNAQLVAIVEEDTVEDITGYTWLYPPERLIKMEVTNKFSCIWIVAGTPERLFQHSLDKEAIDSVTSNVKSDVNYRYIVSESVLKQFDDEHHRELQDTFADRAATFVAIPDNEFLTKAPTDFVIIDPQDPMRRKVF